MKMLTKCHEYICNSDDKVSTCQDLFECGRKDSLERLGLSSGRLITAEVKAPLVILHEGEDSPKCSAENRLRGVVTKITKGEVNTEYIVKISEMIEICAVVSSIRSSPFELNIGDCAWALFNCSAVVLHVD